MTALGGNRSLAAARHYEDEDKHDLQRRNQPNGCNRSKLAETDASVRGKEKADIRSSVEGQSAAAGRQ
jgi:hypothetical protein